MIIERTVFDKDGNELDIGDRVCYLQRKWKKEPLPKPPRPNAQKLGVDKDTGWIIYYVENGIRRRKGTVSADILWGIDVKFDNGAQRYPWYDDFKVEPDGLYLLRLERIDEKESDSE